jgi:hypothetical protein
MVRINDPGHPESVDIGTGKYDVTITTGPTYATRRQQATDQMMQLIQAKPDLAGIIGDLVIGEMDLVNGDKIQERVKRTIPPQVLGDDADDGKDPQEIAAQAAKAQEAEQVQQIGMQLEMRGKQAETTLKEAQAEKAQAEAERAQAEAMKAKLEAMQLAQGGDDEAASRLQIEGYNAVTNRLKAVGAVTPDSPPSLEEHLAPVIAKVVGDALKLHLGIGAQQAQAETPPEDIAA